jgi:hypothetical protein
VISSGGNVAIGIGGSSNIAVFATAGQLVTGIMSVSGNITGGNIDTSTMIASIASVSGNITGGNLQTAGLASIAGNITGGNVLAGILTATQIMTATGNVIGGNLATAGLVTASGNVTGGNIRTAGLVSATGTVTGSSIIGNGSQLTAVAAVNITNGGGWSVTPSGSKLYFNFNGVNLGSLDSSGNFIVLGNVSAFGTP